MQGHRGVRTTEEMPLDVSDMSLVHHPLENRGGDDRVAGEPLVAVPGQIAGGDQDRVAAVAPGNAIATHIEPALIRLALLVSAAARLARPARRPHCP